jgi:hypothetical protein
MSTRLKNGEQVADRRLDRLVQFDERSRDYSVIAMLPRAVRRAEPVTRMWRLGPNEPVLDQGSEGACVGFGVTNELRFNPVPCRGLDDVFARQRIYWVAQRDYDAWPGGAYPGAQPSYEGTSVLAGLKAAQAACYVTEYRWAFGEPDLAMAVSYIGPCVLGLKWWTGMFNPDARGYLRPTGEVEGGHCVLAIGINMRSDYYTIYNSWGPDWGRKGKAKISRTDMAALLADDGEAAIITGRTRPTS